MVKFGHLIVRSYLIHVYKLKKVTIGKDGKAQYYTEVSACLYPKTAGGGISGSRSCLLWFGAKYGD